jgi:hypothetical protein
VIYGTFVQFLYDNIITPIQYLWYPVALKNKKIYTTLIFKWYINALNNQEKTQMVLDGAVSYIFIVTGNQMFITITCNKHLVSCNDKNV